MGTPALQICSKSEHSQAFSYPSDIIFLLRPLTPLNGTRENYGLRQLCSNIVALFYSAFLQKDGNTLTIFIFMPKKSLNSDNFGASSSKVVVAAPPWFSTESEDDEPPTQKLKVDACVMAMENVYLREVNVYRTHVRNYTHKEACARRVIIADHSPLGADTKIPAISALFPNNSPRSILVIML